MRSKCPQCHSSKINIDYPTIMCLSCGYSEGLIDFEINWNAHRSLSIRGSRPDPGPNTSQENTDDLKSRITELESHTDQGNVPRHLYDQLRGQVLFLQKKLNEHTDRQSKRRKNVI